MNNFNRLNSSLLGDEDFMRSIENQIISINNQLSSLSQALGFDLAINQIESKAPIEKSNKSQHRIKGLINRGSNKSEKSLYERVETPEVRESMFVPPPKTDWERVDVNTSEKDKILRSIRANPKSRAFSKEFKWDPSEFLSAFEYLENSESYSGPFIVTVVEDKGELEKYSEIDKISEGINSIYVGKYVLLSVYDIITSSYVYLGLNFDQMSGTLKFDALGSIGHGIHMLNKKHAIQYMKSMNIEFDFLHSDLKIINNE